MNIEIITKELDKKITIMDFHNIYYYHTLVNEMVVYFEDINTQKETYKVFKLDKIINFNIWE